MTTLPSVDVLIQGMVLLPVLSLVGQYQRAMTLFATARWQDLEYLASLADEGKLKPVIDRVYPLDQAVQRMTRASLSEPGERSYWRSGERKGAARSDIHKFAARGPSRSGDGGIAVLR